MSLPVYLTDASSLAGVAEGDVVRLQGPEGRHAATVRRTVVGERIRLADGVGTVVTGEVVAVAKSMLEVRVEERSHEPEPVPRFVLVQALAKGDRDTLAIEAATECGVDEVVPWQAGRSIVQWRCDRAAKSAAKWDATLVAATKQARRARRPVLAGLVTTVQVAERIRSGATAYVLHEEATEPLAGQGLPVTGDVLVIVGPEGGIGREELELLVSAGARAVRLGAQVLRSSTAGPAALAVLSAQDRWR
jgi:16S rRNA (uracil1498-N3)-methyltransferase